VRGPLGRRLVCVLGEGKEKRCLFNLATGGKGGEKRSPAYYHPSSEGRKRGEGYSPAQERKKGVPSAS